MAKGHKINNSPVGSRIGHRHQLHVLVSIPRSRIIRFLTAPRQVVLLEERCGGSVVALGDIAQRPLVDAANLVLGIVRAKELKKNKNKLKEAPPR